MKRLSILLGALCFVMTAVVQAMPITNGKVKWSQSPDMVNAEDTLSMHRSLGPVVADDFLSDGQELIGFHWWGSYFEDTGQGAERDVSFEISFHENCLAGDPTCNNGGPFPFSTPSNGNYFSDIFTVEEDFYGTTSNGVDIYEYWVRVDPDFGPSFLGGTWETIVGETYWVDVAWDAGQFGTAVSDDVWGWAKANNGGVCILGCAVQTAPGGPANPHIGPWIELTTEDKAFEVVSVPEPTTLALMGIGLFGMAYRLRRKQAH